MSPTHAWVVIGHRTSATGITTLYRHDDQFGPYLEVADPSNEKKGAHTPWEVAITPMPARVYLPAEQAEMFGRAALETLALTEEIDVFTNATLTFHTYAIRSNRFKAGAKERLPDEMANGYRLANLPGYVWVVEAVDNELAGQGLPAVVGEALLDSTAQGGDWLDDPDWQTVIAAHTGGVGQLSVVDTDVHNKIASTRPSRPTPRVVLRRAGSRPTYDGALPVSGAGLQEAPSGSAGDSSAAVPAA